MVGETVKPYDGGYDYGVWLCPGNQQKLDELIEKHEVRSVLEIGSCYGASAVWFARHPQIERVTCIDLWCSIPEHGVPPNILEIFMRNCQSAGVAGKVYPVIGDSHKESTLARVGLADLVYFDGDHTYRGCLMDILMFDHLARKVLCGDDYDADLPSVAGVIRAVDALVPDRQTFGRFWWEEKQ